MARLQSPATRQKEQENNHTADTEMLLYNLESQNGLPWK